MKKGKKIETIFLQNFSKIIIGFIGIMSFGCMKLDKNMLPND